MEPEKLDSKFLQSYVYSEHGKFFVSTCYRKSSAMTETPSWFYETFAWRIDDKGERTDWVADNSGSKSKIGAYAQHIEVVKQLHETGVFVEPD